MKHSEQTDITEECLPVIAKKRNIYAKSPQSQSRHSNELHSKDVTVRPQVWVTVAPGHVTIDGWPELLLLGAGSLCRWLQPLRSSSASASLSDVINIQQHRRLRHFDVDMLSFLDVDVW